MDPTRFDRLTRTLAPSASRRRLLRGLAVFGLVAGPGPEVVTSKKRKKKRVKRNAFGCVNVGGFCQNVEQCCSGICQGEKGKKRCQAHDTGGCQPGIQDMGCDPAGTNVDCTTSLGAPNHLCRTTTGGAAYCGLGGCFPCKKDADCQKYCGPRAACVVCGYSCADEGGTVCANPEEEGCYGIIP